MKTLASGGDGKGLDQGEVTAMSEDVAGSGTSDAPEVPPAGEDDAVENLDKTAVEPAVESLLGPEESPSFEAPLDSAKIDVVVSYLSPKASATGGGNDESVSNVGQQPSLTASLGVPGMRVSSATVPSITTQNPSRQPSGFSEGVASRISYEASLKESPSVGTLRPSTALLAVPPPHFAPLGLGSMTARGPGPRSSRSPRSRSIMSLSTGTAASRTSRGSIISKQAQQLDLLSPGLRKLISRLADTKDVNLIAYLSAVPVQPQRGSRVPAPVRSLTKQPMRPMKSIMKISKNQIRFEPTYRMEPLRPFNVDRAYALLNSALETGLSDASYSDQWAGDACRILAAYITNSIKNMDFARYKIATKVTVIERNFQGVQTVLRALWDTQRDRYCAAQVQTTSLIGMAVVFAVYWD